MNAQPHIPLPPLGFDELARDEQVAYVNSLWDRIAASQEGLPVPRWHLDVLAARLDVQNAETVREMSWDEVEGEYERRIQGRQSI